MTYDSSADDVICGGYCEDISSKYLDVSEDAPCDAEMSTNNDSQQDHIETQSESCTKSENNLEHHRPLGTVTTPEVSDASNTNGCNSTPEGAECHDRENERERAVFTSANAPNSGHSEEALEHTSRPALEGSGGLGDEDTDGLEDGHGDGLQSENTNGLEDEDTDGSDVSVDDVSVSADNVAMSTNNTQSAADVDSGSLVEGL